MIGNEYRADILAPRLTGYGVCMCIPHSRQSGLRPSRRAVWSLRISHRWQRKQKSLDKSGTPD